MVAIPLQGELQGLRLAELLLDLERAGFGGSLQLARGRLSKTLLFREGAPVYAESNLASESLGVQLLDAGLLDRTQHLEVSKHMQERKCKEGAALLELGLLDARGLFTALKGQVRTRILECFSWRDGSFQVDPELMPSVDTQPFRARVPQLVQEGLEANCPAERIRAGLAERLDTAVFPTPRLVAVHPQLALDDEVRRFLAELDGGARLRNLLETVRSTRALAAIWVLFRAEALGPGDPEAGVSGQRAARGRSARQSPEEPDARPGTAGRGAAAGDPGFREEIEQTFSKLSELDFYQLLGVSMDASTETIRRAYLRAATRLHPDALVHAGLDVVTWERANKVFAAMGKARAQLSDAARRREYDASLQEQESAELEGERALAAETSYRKGEILVKQGNFRGAVAFFEASVSLCPDEATYVGALGWALFKQNPPDVPLAREHLERARALAPDNKQLARKFRQLTGESGAGLEPSA